MEEDEQAKGNESVRAIVQGEGDTQLELGVREQVVFCRWYWNYM